MSKESVYNAHALPTPPDGGIDRQIAGFTQASMTSTYQGAYRREAHKLGRPIPPIKLRNPDALAPLQAESQRVAQSIPSVGNRMLRNALDQMPADATDAQLTARAKEIQAGIRAYNNDTLLPQIKAIAENQGQADFYSRNGIDSTWQIVRTSGSDTPDDCQDAVDEGEMSADQLAALDGPPFHANCQCAQERVSVDESTIPATDELWTGD